MRIAVVQTYPVYHDFYTTEQWLALENRDRWIPGILADMGHEVELWGGDVTSSTHRSVLAGMGDYTIRLFATEQNDRRTKFHTSDALAAYAREFKPDVVLLKGVDGGIGTHVIRHVLASNRVPYVFIIGGTYYNRYVPRAAGVFYETEAQREHLMQPGLRFWRRPVAPEKLLRMPKSIDTDLFRPMPEIEKRWDVLVAGRLRSYYKSYDEVGLMAEKLRVAVAGSGPMEAELRAKYPKVTWLGKVAHAEMPAAFNAARTFMHTSKRDFFPRVLSEAMACGIPGIAFADAIAPDVLPPTCGVRVQTHDFVSSIQALLQDEPALAAMSRNSRAHALESFSKLAARQPLEAMLQRLFPSAATSA